MKKSIIFAFLLMMAGYTAMAQGNSKVEHLTYKEFRNKIWDFEKSPNNYVFKGETPAIVDFYASWCGPCRKAAPIMEKLAEEYAGRLSVYKVNVEEERDLARAFNVRSIPMVLFFPKEGQPMQQVGLMPESEYRKIVEEQLLK